MLVRKFLASLTAILLPLTLITVSQGASANTSPPSLPNASDITIFSSQEDNILIDVGWMGAPLFGHKIVAQIKDSTSNSCEIPQFQTSCEITGLTLASSVEVEYFVERSSDSATSSTATSDPLVVGAPIAPNISQAKVEETSITLSLTAGELMNVFPGPVSPTEFEVTQTDESGFESTQSCEAVSLQFPYPPFQSIGCDVTFNNLSTGDDYTYQAVARVVDSNNSAESGDSDSMTLSAGEPATPALSITAGDKTLDVALSPSNQDGVAPTSFEITYFQSSFSNPSPTTTTETCTAVDSECIITLTDLENFATYVLTATASNSYGTSEPSGEAPGEPLKEIETVPSLVCGNGASNQNIYLFYDEVLKLNYEDSADCEGFSTGFPPPSGLTDVSRYYPVAFDPTLPPMGASSGPGFQNFVLEQSRVQGASEQVVSDTLTLTAQSKLASTISKNEAAGEVTFTVSYDHNDPTPLAPFGKVTVYPLQLRDFQLDAEPQISTDGFRFFPGCEIEATSSDLSCTITGIDFDKSPFNPDIYSSFETNLIPDNPLPQRSFDIDIYWTPKLLAPTNHAVTATSDGQIDLQWDAREESGAGSGIDEYEVTYTESGGSEQTKICDASSTPTSTSGNTVTETCSLSSLTVGGEYDIEIRTVDTAGRKSEPTSTLTATAGTSTGPSTVTVTFDSTDGSGTMASQTASASENLNANTLTPPTGYKFDGWSLDPDGTTLDYADEASFDFSSGSDLTLYARWAVDGFIVTFNANGGVGSMDPQIAKTDTALNINTFTNGEQTFEKWTTNQDGTGDDYTDEESFPFTSSGSQTLFAQWLDASDKTVQFDANAPASEISGSMDDQETNSPTRLSSNQFERNNYAFEKWSTNPDGSGTVFNDEELFDFDQDLTLYAQWVETKSYSVTFNGNGANAGTMTAQTASEPTALNTNNFTRWNRSFLGWSTTSNGSIEYEDKEIYEFEEDVVLYARWGTGVTITFDENASDATGSMSNQVLSANKVLKTNEFERPGFVFSHWATSGSGGGTKYPDGWAGPVFPKDTTLYAQWVEDTGAMAIFNANRGSLGSLMPPQDLSSADNLSANTFKKPNWRFRFKEWNTEPDGTGTPYSDKELVTLSEDTVLYAQWGYNIQLRHGGGTPRTFENVVVDSPATIPESPFTRSGYAFAGWTNTGGTFSFRTIWYHPGDPIKINRQIILHAKWVPIDDPDDNLVTFASNYGTPITGKTFLNTQAGTEPTRLDPTPYERAGFTFKGWSTLRNGPVAYSDQEVFDFDQNQVLHAVWWQNRVTFQPNGGSGSKIFQSSRRDLPLRTNTYSYSGKVFAGWNTAPDGTGNSYADGQTFPFGSPEQTLTLYAQWEDQNASEKTVFFNANGATAGVMPPQQSGSAGNLNPNKFTRTGYQFAGWDTGRNGGVTAYEDEDSYDFIVNDVLFAQWTPLVTYRPNGGDGATTYQEITSSNHTLAPNTFTRSGYNFLGWARTASAGPAFADAQTLDLGNITNRGARTFYAKWEEVSGSEKTVVFQSNYESQAVRWQTSDTAANLNDPFSRKGYTMLGWATSPSGSVEYEAKEEYDFQNNAVLYAVWQPNTISFDANGGKGSMPDLVSSRNTPLSANQFERTGFVFSTWNTEPDGSGRTYSGGLTFPTGQVNQSTTLYAQWVAVPGSQVISFNANGGTGSMRTQVTASNSDLVLAPNGFQRDGYTFTEWNTAGTGAGDAYQEGETIEITNSNLTLYAMWEDDGSITNQTVSFDENGGSGTMSDQTVNGRTVLTSNSFNRSNHVFTGWNEQRNGSGKGYADNSQIFTLEDKTLYAQWLQLAGTDVAISFDPNGGTGQSMSPLVDAQGESVTLPGSSFSRAGFIFLGWDTDDSATTATYQAGDDFTLPSSADTLFAIWEAEFFTVIFDENGGNGTMASQTSDEETNLFANKFTRDKYEFKGWSTTNNGVVEYADAAQYDFPTDKGNTLFAIWEQVDFTVEFKANGGTGSMPDQTASGTQPLAANTFTRDNHRFLGWRTSSSGAVEYENAEEFDFSVDDELFAIWESLSTVTFHANGGTGSMAKQTGSAAAPLRLNEFEYEDFTFTGWATSTSGAVAYADGGRYGFSASADLYAQWTPTTYTVTFNANDGDGFMSAQTAAGSNNLSAMSGLTRTGYTFLGWNTNPNASSALYADEASFDFEEDLVLYAIWSKTENSVTWDSNGGTNVLGSNFVIGDTIAKPTDPTRSGKVFGGWSTSETSDQGDAANVISSWPYTPPSPTNITFHAVWFDTCSTTDSTFNLNGDDYYGIEVRSGADCVISVPDFVSSVDALVVGGGGGGGENVGTGGGGGGVTVKTSIDASPTDLIFATVGSGGSGANYQTRTSSTAASTERNGGDGGNSEISIGSLNLFAGGGKGGKTYWSENVCLVGGSNRNALDQATGGLSDSNADSGVGGQGGLGGDGGSGSGFGGEATADGYSINFLGTSIVFGSGGGGGGFEAPGGFAGAGAGAGGSGKTEAGKNASPNQGGGGGGGSSDCNQGGAGGSGLVALRFLAPTFTVSFQADSEGTGSLADLTKVYGQDLSLPSSTDANNAFTRTGYMVGGWATSDGGSQAYELAETYTTEQDLTLYPLWVPLEVIASGDTYVQSGQSSDSNFGSEEVLVLKNAASSLNNDSNRVGYLEFSYSPNAVWSNAVLEMTVVDNFDGTNGTEYGNSYTTFNIDVYGATDASWDESTLDFQEAISSNLGWGIDDDSWPWGTNLATHLGTLSVPTDSSSDGQLFSLSSIALDEFLNDDADGNITLVLVRTDTDPEGNISLATKENTTYQGPTLALTDSGYEYTVAYDINGGSGNVPNSGSFINGGSAYAVESTTGITPPTDKTIVGWNSEADGSGTDYASGDSYNTSRSLTLYAKYIDNPVVTFDSNFPGGPTETSQAIPPSVATDLNANTFDYPGYVFDSWNSEADATGDSYLDKAEVTITEDLILYAQWVGDNYLVIYEYNGADGGNSNLSESYTTGEADLTLPVPTRTGYSFDGWFENSDFSGSVLPSNYTTQKDRTLYAKWTAEDYTVSYETDDLTTEADSGTAPTDSNTYNIGDSVSVSGNSGNLVSAGYVFDGWTVNPLGLGTVYQSGDSLIVADSDIVLYAKWTPGTYTVSFDINGGSGTTPPVDSFTTEETGLNLPDDSLFGKTGYVFDGWSAFVAGPKQADGFEPTEDVTLFARWNIKTITYTFAEGATGSTSRTTITLPGDASDDYAAEIELPAMQTTDIDTEGDSATDYIFAGWSDGNNVYKAGDDYRLGSTTVNFTAQWAKVYQVRYVFNGGVAFTNEDEFDDQCLGNDNTCVSGQTVRSNHSPTRDGYNFNHWLDQSDNQIDADTNFTVSDGSYVLYAQWTAIPRTFSFDSDGGSNTPANQTGTIGETITIPSPGNKTGYTFDHWDDTVGTYPVGGVYTVDLTDASFTAQWTPNTYTVSFDWQGGQLKAGQTAVTSDTYTVGDPAMTLPNGNNYERDGYNFAGWATSPNGSLVTNAQPTSDADLFAVWADGSYSITLDPKGGNLSQTNLSVDLGDSFELPSVTREDFVFTGWFDQASGGNKLGDGGDTITPTGSATIYARWVQESLFGIDMAGLESVANINVGSTTAGSVFKIHGNSSTSALVDVPAGALPDNTVVSVRFFKDTQSQEDLIAGSNDFLVSLLVSWLTGTGDSATVPDTDANKPIEVTFTASAIKAGQRIYQLIGDEVTDLGVAQTDGAITVYVTEDPALVVVSTAPDAPTSVSGTAGGSKVTISWTAPVANGGSEITGYTVTSSTGETCTTTTLSCVFEGLKRGTFTVVATNAIGDSEPSAPTSIAPSSNRPATSAPIEEEGLAADIPVAYGQTKVWTQRISDTEVKVYIKFPEMGAHYRINVQKNGGEYKNRMRKTINTTADPGLRVVGDWYYLVRTVVLDELGRYRIEIREEGERTLVNGRARPVVYTLD